MKRVKDAVLAAALLAILLATAAGGQDGEGRQRYAAASLEEGQQRYTATFLDVFDTVTEITGYADSQEEFTRQAELLKERLAYYHRLYDIYHVYEGINNIKTINDNAGIAPVKVDGAIIELLRFSQEMYLETDGQINIAMGSVLSLWHDCREAGIENSKEAALPAVEELRAAGEHMDLSQLVIDGADSETGTAYLADGEKGTAYLADGETGTAYLADGEMSLDVGGIGKGYAVQRAAEYARSLGMERVLISVGGNICAVGEKSPGVPWRLGIRNPDLESETPYVVKVDVADVSVVTSGDYQRYYTVDGVRYSHIIDPDTLMPPGTFASVSIIAADSGRADALSTAVYNMSFEEGLSFVNGIRDAEAMWIFPDGSIRYSEGFEAYLAVEP